MRSDLTVGRTGLWLALSAAVLWGSSLTARASAQISVGGGLQSVPWTKDCSTAESFVNGTGLTLAGMWIGIGNDGATNTPEIRDITLTNLGATRIWDVDDNEDGDNDDASEGDVVDSTPTTGLPAGWHRLQARANAHRFLPGETFTIKLCSSSSTSLSGTTIFLIPMAPSALAGGDSSVRTEAPFSVSEAFPNASVAIEGVNAPPGSTTFKALVTNADPQKRLSKLRIDPPMAVTIVTAMATKGAVYDGPSRTIIWPTPIALGSSAQLTVTLSSVGRILTTTVGFVGTEFLLIGAPAVPSLPAWGLAFLVAFVLLGGYALLRQRG